MKIQFTLSAIALIIMTAATSGCGSKISGSYDLTANGAAGSNTGLNGQPCNPMKLNVQENSGSITGSGTNACGSTVTMTATMSNNTNMRVNTFSIIQNQGAPGMSQNAYGITPMSYQGDLIISGNSISGMLMGPGGQMQIQGTRTN